MEPWDDRGQSIQIGAVLIFAVLILAFSSYQAFVVPQQNQQTEFEHNQAIKGDLLDLRNAVVSTLGRPSAESVSVRLGTTYPARAIATNPPPPSGTLRTVGTADGTVNLSVENAAAVDPETDDFWDGTRRNYSTGGVEYRPNYHEYGQPPVTVYEASVLYDRFEFEGTNLTRSDQALVDGDRIRLVALNGSLRRSSSGTTAVDVRSVSASDRTVSVRNDATGDPVVVRVATQLSESTWEELLADQRADEGGNVSTATDAVRTEPLSGVPGYETLVVELVPGSYELQMAKAGVGTRVDDTEPAYLTTVSGNGSTVPAESSQQFVVELRDRYNNPIGDEWVTANSSWAADGVSSKRTDGNGRVSFLYETPAVSGDLDGRINVSIGRTAPDVPFGGGTPENASLNVTVVDTSVESSSNSGSDPYSLDWQSPTEDNDGSFLSNCDDSDCTWDVGADSDDELTLRALAETLDADPAPIEDLAVDFAADNTSVATLGSSSGVTTGSGETTLTIQAAENGTVGVFAASGDASDRINVTVENVTGASRSTVRFRVDDLTNLRGNVPRYAASYDVSGIDGAEDVEIEFRNTDSSGASQTLTSPNLRGSLSYEGGYGANEQYEITVRALDAAGSVVATETISDTADAANPTSQNADLSEQTSASIDSYTIEDRSNTNSNKVRYRFDYTVSGSGSFSQVRLFVLNLDGNGATGTQSETSRSGNSVDVNPGDGTGASYRVGIAVYDASGAIVEVVDTTDTPSGSGTVLPAAIALLALALVGDAIRRSSKR